MRFDTPRAILCKSLMPKVMLEWRNWQTHGTQNPAPFTGHVGSTPTSSTKKVKMLGSILVPGNQDCSRARCVRIVCEAFRCRALRAACDFAFR